MNGGGIVNTISLRIVMALVAAIILWSIYDSVRAQDYRAEIMSRMDARCCCTATVRFRLLVAPQTARVPPSEAHVVQHTRNTNTPSG